MVITLGLNHQMEKKRLCEEDFHPSVLPSSLRNFRPSLEQLEKQIQVIYLLFVIFYFILKCILVSWMFMAHSHWVFNFFWDFNIVFLEHIAKFNQEKIEQHVSKRSDQFRQAFKLFTLRGLFNYLVIKLCVQVVHLVSKYCAFALIFTLKFVTICNKFS